MHFTGRNPFQMRMWASMKQVLCTQRKLISGGLPRCVYLRIENMFSLCVFRVKIEVHTCNELPATCLNMHFGRQNFAQFWFPNCISEAQIHNVLVSSRFRAWAKLPQPCLLTDGMRARRCMPQAGRSPHIVQYE